MSGDQALDDIYAALLDGDAEALYERAPCGYLSTTPDGTIIKVNQTLLSWLGYERRDLVGRRSFVELLSPGGRIYHETHYAPMLQMQGKVREIALDLVRADGRRVPALVNSVLERDANGAALVVRTAVFDATERRQYERELLRAKQRAEDSEARAVLLARTLQQTLIPPALPAIAGLDIAAAYRPAGSGEEVGGDFYDVFQIGPDDWVAVVGDVCGKGVDAAVVTALARYTIRAAAVRHRRPSEALQTLNEVLLHHETDRFCTVVLLRLRRSDAGWRVSISSGGHPPPLVSRGGGEPEILGRSGTLLGIFPTATLHDVETELHPGDAIVVYTDGVPEGRHGDDWYGEGRLRRAVTVHAGTATSLTEGILDDVVRFQSGRPRDDIVILALTVPAADGLGGRPGSARRV